MHKATNKSHNNIYEKAKNMWHISHPFSVTINLKMIVKNQIEKPKTDQVVAEKYAALCVKILASHCFKSETKGNGKKSIITAVISHFPLYLNRKLFSSFI